MILRGVMDPGWVEAALAAIDSVRRVSDDEPGETFGPGGLLGLPEPHAAPVRF